MAVAPIEQPSGPESEEPASDFIDYAAVLEQSQQPQAVDERPMIGESNAAFRERTGQEPKLKIVASEEKAAEPRSAALESQVPEISKVTGRLRGPKLRSHEDIIKPNDQFRRDYIEAQHYIDKNGQDTLDDLHEATRQVAAAGEHQAELAARPVNERIIDKTQLVAMARERVGSLKEDQMAVHGEAKAVKAAALEQMANNRELATTEYSRVDQAVHKLTGPDGELSGNVGVKFIGDDEVDLQLTKEVEGLVARGDTPIEETDYRDGELLVKRLSYEGSGKMTVVERWDRQTGRLLALNLVKSRSPATQTKADTESTSPIAFLRGQFRELIGREGPLVVLSPEITSQLGSLQRPEAAAERSKTPVESRPLSFSSSEGYQRYVDNLSFLGNSEAYINQAKKKRPAKNGFFAELFANFSRARR